MRPNIFKKPVAPKSAQDGGWSGTAPLNSSVVTPAGGAGAPAVAGSAQGAGPMAQPSGTGAIQNVGAGQPYMPAKEEVIGNPYLTAFERQKAATAEAQRTQYVPDSKRPGKAVADWASRVFGSSGKPTNTEASRASRQKLAAVTQMLRYAGQLAYMPKGAVPQAVNDQVAQNEAKWLSEDALAAKNAQAQRDYELKLRKQLGDEGYKQGQLALGADRNEIARGNLAIALGKDARDAEAHGWKAEDRPYDLAAKAAGVEEKKARAKEAGVKAEYAGRINEAKLAQIRQATATSAAAAAHHRASIGKINLEKKKLINGTGDDKFFLSGEQGTFSRKSATSPAEKANIIYRAHQMGLIDDKTYTAVHSRSSWMNDVEFQTKQDDVIAQLLDYAGEEETVRDLFTSNGFHYTPYQSKKSTKVAKLK